MEATFKTKWIEPGLVSRLICELNDGTKVNEGGSITFVADDHSDLFFLLADCVATKGELPRRDISTISCRAFLELRKNGPVDRDKLRSAISRKATELLALPRVPHTMWSKMRLRQMAFSRGARFEYDGVRIRTVANLPKWLQLDEYFISGIGHVNPNDLPLFGYIIAIVDARNENEASKRIFSALDTFFAIANTLSRQIEFWVERRPTAKFWLGPHQFFFKEKTFLGEGKLWSNTSFDKQEWESLPQDAQRFYGASPHIRRSLEKLQSHPLRRPIENTLRSISDGMISRDLAYRLMRFWSAAESLYSIIDQKTMTSKIIDRMAFSDGERKWLTKLKLNRAYNLRNQYVHHGSTDGDDTSLVQYLREVVLNFVYYLLYNGDDISTHEELLMILDLPADVDALSRRATAIERRKLIDSTGRHRSE